VPCANSARSSQERLGKGSGLSGKFIGEVERGEKSISIDSLYRVSVALEVPLRELTDVGDKHSTVPTERPRKSSRWCRVGGARKTSARPTTFCARCSAALVELRHSPASSRTPARSFDDRAPR
jgi:transcriptional regulator with XRE-family HTH domain